MLTVFLFVPVGFAPSKSRQAPFPFDKTFNADSISKLGEKIWTELMGPKSDVGKINYMGLAFHGLDSGETGQKSIEGFFGERGAKRKREDDDGEDEEEPPLDESSWFRCSRCGKRIALTVFSEDAEEMAGALAALKIEHDDFHFAQDLSRQHSEEEAPRRDSVKPTSSRTSSTSSGGKKKKKVESKGIGRYFAVKPPSAQ